MSSDNDTYVSALALLSSLTLEDVAAQIFNLVSRASGSQEIAVAVWDSEMEYFSSAEKLCFGPKLFSLKKLLEEVCERYNEIKTDAPLFHLKPDEFPIQGKAAVYELAAKGELCGFILIADELSREWNDAELKATLDRYPIAVALRNSWLHAELERENNRLRNQFEQIEDNNQLMEEQTRKLIHDITAKDSIRTRQVERERLVYYISALVKNSLRLGEVLKTSVEKIGEVLTLSRCQVIRSNNTNDQIEIYEFHDNKTCSAKELLQSEDGRQFTLSALSTHVPLSLDDPDVDDQKTFNVSFLKRLGLKSGLVVPMTMRDRALGVLFLQDCERHREWSIDDISLLGSLADQVAIGIENAELHLEVERQAVTDGLTGVANRRSFNEALEKEFERATRYNQSLSLAVVDLDFLKKINDTYGHMTGDEAICAIGTVLRQFSRSTDFAARYGGEEFCVLLPNTGIEMASQLAERLRRLINETWIEGPGNVSASIGVASFPLHADSADSLFLRADEALYRAKQDGRNRVKVSEIAPDGSRLGPTTHSSDPQSPLVPQEKSSS